MKKLLLPIFFFTLCTALYADDETWSGQLKVQQTALTLVFHLNEDNCTMDSPDQGAKGIPALLERTDVGVKVQVPAIGASFEGVFYKDRLVGTFVQQGHSFPLTLTKGVQQRRRPQTPQPPFPYTTQEVSFVNGDAVLKGTLTLPEHRTKDTPAVLMVTGSGLQNRDEELFDHKPFAVLADALARQGIATLRYDDRGFGESTGDVVNATVDDFKDDAVAGVALLRKQFAHVGILGHSEGGTIALMMAAEKGVDFVVSLAGMVVSGKATLLQQNRDALREAGCSEEIIDRYCAALDEIFTQAAAGRGLQIPDSKPTATDSKPTAAENKTNSAENDLPAELKQNLQVVAAQASTPYMQHFITLDVSARLGKVVCPVLALNGTRDRQVDCEANLNALRAGLKAKKDIRAVEGVNHLFQHCTTGSVAEYKDIEETIAPEVMDAVIQWVKKLF